MDTGRIDFHLMYRNGQGKITSLFFLDVINTVKAGKKPVHG